MKGCVQIRHSAIQKSFNQQLPRGGKNGICKRNLLCFVLVTVHLQMRGSEKLKVLVTQLCLTLCDPWTVAHQTPLSMEFSRQECWNGLPFLTPEDLLPGIKTRSPTLQADSLSSESPEKPYIIKQHDPTVKIIKIHI